MNEVGADGKCLKKFEHSWYGVVCTSPSRVTSSWVSMTEAAVSFEVLYFLFKGPKISDEKCKRHALSDFVTMKAPLWKHPMPLGFGGNSCRRSWIDLRTSLIIKSSVKTKKLPILQVTCQSRTVRLGLKFHHCLSQADSYVPNGEA